MKSIKIKTKLSSDIIHLENIEEWIGKEVEIIIKEVINKDSGNKKWPSSGSADMHGKLDDLNIRDFSYE